MFNKKKKSSGTKISIKDIENQEAKTKFNINPNKKDKNMGPKTVTKLKYVKIFLWCALIFILLMGVVQMVRSKKPRIIKNTIDYNFTPVETDTAKAFAVTFAKEFLTYKNTEAVDYNQRIAPFLISSIQGGEKIEVSEGSSKAVDAIVWKVEKLNANHSNITVRVNVVTNNTANAVDTTNVYGQAEKNPTAINEVIYLTVPIGYYNGGFLVEDYPTFSADPIKPADPSLETYTGQNKETDTTANVIKDVLTNFFKIYTTGNVEQISYYMENNKKIAGYQGKYLFNSIDQIDAYNVTSDTTVAVVQVSMKDATLGTVFTQRFTFTLRKPTTNNQKRWYIIDFTSRGNIYK